MCLRLDADRSVLLKAGKFSLAQGPVTNNASATDNHILLSMQHYQHLMFAVIIHKSVNSFSTCIVWSNLLEFSVFSEPRKAVLLNVAEEC